MGERKGEAGRNVTRGVRAEKKSSWMRRGGNGGGGREGKKICRWKAEKEGISPPFESNSLERGAVHNPFPSFICSS